MTLETAERMHVASAWRRLAPYAAFAFLLAAAIGIELCQPFQGQLAHAFVNVVKAAMAEPTLPNVLMGGLAALGWAIHALARPLLIFAAFLLVEIALVGPPRSWKVTAYALGMNAGTILFFLILGPVVARVLPDSWGVQPMLHVSADDAPVWLMAFAPVALALVSILVFNLGQYWAHRLQHTIPFLWRFHAVHHSIEDLDSLNSFTHPVDSLGERLFMITIAAIVGFDFESVIWLVAIQAMHDRLLHTRAPINFGWAGRVFVDNRYHFMHHSIRPEDYNRNFSAWFTVWDHLFGTYKLPPPGGLVQTGVLEVHAPTTASHFFLARLPSRDPASLDLTKG
jgi:sterol desaturase/sphingolipid hydroxylase (fatty acid hydroxylase superfamily)